MTEFKNGNQPSKRARAAQRAGAIRRRRIAAVREREARIEQTVVDVLAARLAIEEAQRAVTDGIGQLKTLGETQESIAELCEMSPHEIRTALARTNTATDGGTTSAGVRELPGERADRSAGRAVG